MDGRAWGASRGIAIFKGNPETRDVLKPKRKLLALSLYSLYVAKVAFQSREIARLGFSAVSEVENGKWN